MGMAGFKGTIKWLNLATCPVFNSLGKLPVPSGTAVRVVDEITKFTAVDSALKREYGHDKSGGWQDVCVGTRRLGITVEAVISNADLTGLGGDGDIWAGKIAWLELYPVGLGATCSQYPAMGYAVVDQVSYTYDQETGKPNSYTATLSSKGNWTNVGGDSDKWGGFECVCTDS